MPLITTVTRWYDLSLKSERARGSGVFLVRSLGTIVILAAVSIVLPALAQSPNSDMCDKGPAQSRTHDGASSPCERRNDVDLRGRSASDTAGSWQTGQIMIANLDKKRYNHLEMERTGRRPKIAPLKKRTEEQRRDEIEKDLALYKKIADLPSSKDIVPKTWKNLTTKYASSGEGILNLEIGYVRMLRMMLLEPLEFVPVKGGCFDMGDTYGDGGGDEQPVHRVCVDDYAIGRFEVTQAQWEAVMGSNPSTFPQCGRNCPVESVSWNAVQEFISTLNAITGGNYRLPTEAEWEYAARSGGRKEKYSGTSKEADLGDYAWFGSNSDSQTHPVGQKKPNSLGIYDMSGNVWEWVEDIYSDTAYCSHDKENPVLMEGSANRVNRGGSWSFEASSLRTALRSYVYPGISSYYVGFRLVKTNSSATGRAAQRDRLALPQGTKNRSATKILGSL